MSHLREQGESYFDHFMVATRAGLTAILSGLILLIHAIVPELMTRSGSETLNKAKEILERK